MTTSSSATVGQLLRVERVPAFVVLSAIGRLPVSMVSLALLLTYSTSSTVGAASAVAAGFGVGFALAAPVKGRLADRHGLTVLLTSGSVIAAAALTAVVAAQPPPVPATLLATAAGIALPQVGASTRAIWAQRFDGSLLLHAAYTLDAITSELAIVIGAALVSIVAAVSGGRAALTVDVLLTLIGGVGIALHPDTRQWRPRVDGHRSNLLGPLRDQRVLAIAGTMLLLSAAIGALTIGLIRQATTLGQPSAGGFLVTATAVGSVLGSILAAIFARYAAGHVTRRRLAVLLTTFGIGLVPLTVVPPVPASAALLVIVFLVAAPTYIAQAELLGSAAASTSRNEAFALGPTTNWAGQAAGTALAGTLTPLPLPVVLALPAALLLIAALAAARRGGARQRGQ